MNPQYPNWQRMEWPPDQRGVQPPQFPISGPPAGIGQAGVQATTTASEAGGQGVGQQQPRASVGTRQPSGTAEGTATPQQPQGTAGPAGPQAASPTPPGQSGGGPAGAPSMDLVETDEEYRVLLDMPGFEKDHISIQADDDSLLVTAERPDELVESTNRTHIRERPVRVQRRLDLPVGTDIEGASATHENGVCTVTIPRTSEGDKRTIGFQ
jgi:HSP20 family protein